MEVVDDPEEEGISFYWTQNKINRVHYKQLPSKNVKMVSERTEGFKRKEPKNQDEK